jgi:hypothetical protein
LAEAHRHLEPQGVVAGKDRRLLVLDSRGRSGVRAVVTARCAPVTAPSRRRLRSPPPHHHDALRIVAGHSSQKDRVREAPPTSLGSTVTEPRPSQPRLSSEATVCVTPFSTWVAP